MYPLILMKIHCIYTFTRPIETNCVNVFINVLFTFKNYMYHLCDCLADLFVKMYICMERHNDFFFFLHQSSVSFLNLHADFFFS